MKASVRKCEIAELFSINVNLFPEIYEFLYFLNAPSPEQNCFDNGADSHHFPVLNLMYYISAGQTSLLQVQWEFTLEGVFYIGLCFSYILHFLF